MKCDMLPHEVTRADFEDLILALGAKYTRSVRLCRRRPP